jgi:hypothetical protein
MLVCRLPQKQRRLSDSCQRRSSSASATYFLYFFLLPILRAFACLVPFNDTCGNMHVVFDVSPSALRASFKYVTFDSQLMKRVVNFLIVEGHLYVGL